VGINDRHGAFCTPAPSTSAVALFLALVLRKISCSWAKGLG